MSRAVAVHKVVGIETEFGILHRCDGDSNPVAASSMIINAYVNGYLCQRVNWDFEDEHPGTDARGFNEFDALAPEIETHLVNAVLTNGARYYVDHAHPELSTPECSDARQCVVYDRAAEEILIRSMEAANNLLPDSEELVIHKNNSDGKGNSYGCHENYLLDRNVPFARVVDPHPAVLRHAASVLRSRQDRHRGADARSVRGAICRPALPDHPASGFLRGGSRA